jgi:Conserved TM helix
MRITSVLADAFGRGISFLPNVLAALIILAVGFLVAKLCDRGTRRLLSAFGLERRASMRRLLGQEASLERVPAIGGRIVYWVLAVITIGVAVDALHLSWLSAGVARALAYVPSVLAAGAIVLIGYLAGNFIYREMARREGSSVLSARLFRGGIFALAAFMALQELRIATAIVTIAFTVALSAMAVAAALAFGLGNRELAGRVTRDWYERRGSAPRGFEPVRDLQREEEDRRPPTPRH